MEEATSEYAPVESGVPQGSVLGPSLFIMYINDLTSSMKTQARLFADDTMCSNKIRNTADQDTLQAELDSLAEWETKWAVEFHPAKCSTLSATRCRQKFEPSCQLHGQQLENIPTIKYLGVVIQENLKWSNHITSITNKVNKTLGFVRRNLKVGNKRAKETAYKALIRPKFEYAASVWDPHTQADIKTLEKVQRRATRWVTSRYRQTSCVDFILTDLDWPTLQNRRKKSRLELFYKFHKGLITINSSHLPSPSNNRLSSRKNNSSGYDIPRNITRYRQMSFFPQTIPEWNALPEEITEAESLDIFKSMLAPLI